MYNPQTGLSFNENGKFKIMVVGDIHEKILPDEKSEDFLRLINCMLDALEPDFAVLMGDIVSSGWYDANGERHPATKDQLRIGVSRVCEPFESRGVPFGLVFGNHDGEGGEPKEVLFELFSEHKGFLMNNDSGATGCGNCNLIIRESENGGAAANMWFMDSGNRAADGSGSYAYLMPDQIEWYEKTSGQLREENGGEPLPALLFQHIPVMEEYELLKKTSILNPYKVRGHGSFSNSYYDIADKEATVGYLGEGPCTPDTNSGQFESWKKQGDVFAAFFGHDHMNDFAGFVDGILLAQCKCSGFHIYGDGLKQGVRIVNLDKKYPGKLETHMRYYREFFGTECNSVKGELLYPDRWHNNFKAGLKVSGALAGIAAVGVSVGLIKKRKKK